MGKKVLRGAGAEACWVSPDGNSGPPDGWFYRWKMKEFASGTVSVSDCCLSRLSEVSRRAFVSRKGSKSGLNSDDFVFSREDNAMCETWNVCGKGTNSETVRE